jgi:hypothetical protein
MFFPESYHGKKSIDGALIQFRGTKGETVKLERTERRSLERLSSSDGRFVAFQNDAADRIYRIED